MLLAAAATSSLYRLLLLVLPWRRFVTTEDGGESRLNVPTEQLERRDTTTEVRTGTKVHRDEDTVDLVSWAVHACERRLPWTTCLSNSLAARWLLRRCGFSAAINLGTYQEGSEVCFHAQVESGGREVYGGRAMTLLASIRS